MPFSEAGLGRSLLLVIWVVVKIRALFGYPAQKGTIILTTA